MGCLVIILNFVILFIIANLIKSKIAKKLVIIYLSYWSLSLLMCNLNIFGLYEVREETYILLIAHLYAFLFGYLVCKQRTKFKATKVILDISYLIKNILFWIIYLSCLYFVYKLVVNQANMFALYSLSEIRQDFEELVLEGSGLLFYQVFAIGMFHFCNCLFIYLLFSLLNSLVKLFL